MVNIRQVFPHLGRSVCQKQQVPLIKVNVDVANSDILDAYQIEGVPVTFIMVNEQRSNSLVGIKDIGIVRYVIASKK